MQSWNGSGAWAIGGSPTAGLQMTTKPHEPASARRAELALALAAADGLLLALALALGVAFADAAVTLGVDGAVVVVEGVSLEQAMAVGTKTRTARVRAVRMLAILDPKNGDIACMLTISVAVRVARGGTGSTRRMCR